jgi:oligosaccharide repeat unit polymerase
MVLADLALRSTRRRMRRAIDNWKPQAMHFPAAEQRQLKQLLIVTIVVLLVPFLLIDNQIGNVIGYFGAAGGESEKIDLRRQYAGSSVYLYNLLTSNVVPFLCFAALAARFIGQWRWRTLIWVFTGLTLLSKLALLSKAPAAIFLIQVLVLHTMTKSLTLSPRKIIALLSFVAGSFVAMVYLLNLGEDTQGLIFDILVYRALMIPNEGVIEYFSAIPYVLDFTWGTQISWVATLFQAEPKLPAYWLVAEVHRGNLGSTTTAMFLADAWSEFAWLGVVLFPTLMGFFARAIDIRTIAFGRPTVWKLAGLAMGHFGIYVAMNTSATTAMFTGGLLFVIPLAVWFPRWLTRRRKHARPPLQPAVADES